MKAPISHFSDLNLAAPDTNTRHNIKPRGKENPEADLIAIVERRNSILKIKPGKPL